MTKWPGNTGRGSTVVVALDGAKESSVAQADIKLNGVDDHIEIDKIMAELNARGGGSMCFTEGLCRPHKQLKYPTYANISVRGQGPDTVIKPKDQAASTLDGDVLATATEFDLVDASDFTIGEEICFYDGGVLYEADKFITNIVGDTVTIAPGLTNGFTSGDAVFSAWTIMEWNNCTDIDLHNFLIDGNKANWPQRAVDCGSHYGLEVSAGLNYILSGIRVKNTVSMGIALRFAKQALVNRCIVKDSNSYGFLFENDTFGSIVSDCVSTGNLHGYLFEYAWNSKLRNSFAYDNTDKGIYIKSTSPYDISISGCDIYSNGGEGIHVLANTSAKNIRIVNNTVKNNVGEGIHFEALSYDCLIALNDIIGNARGIRLTGASTNFRIHNNLIKDNVDMCIYLQGIAGNLLERISIMGNDLYILNTADAAIYGLYAEDVKILNNTFTGLGAGVASKYSIYLNVGNTNKIIIDGNTITDWRSAFRFSGTPTEHIHVKNNILHSNNDTFYPGSDHPQVIMTDQKTEHFQDCLALSANHVVAAEDLSAGSPITCTLATQPDVPRTFSWILTHAQITEYSMAILGIDARGNTITETITEADGWSGETDNAFAVVTSIIFTRVAGTGVGDTLNIGIADKLGLGNIIYASADVFKVKENNADYTNITVDTTHHTVSIDGVIGATNDYTIFYRSNLNIIG